MMEFESITETEQQPPLSPVRARLLDSLLALVVCLVTVIAAFVMLSATEEPWQGTGEPMVIYSDCAGFVTEGGE